MGGIEGGLEVRRWGNSVLGDSSSRPYTWYIC